MFRLQLVGERIAVIRNLFSMFDFNKLNYQNLIESIRKNKIIKTYEFKQSQGQQEHWIQKIKDK